MIEISKKNVIISGKNKKLKIFLNSKLTFKERRNALKVKSIEQCKQLVLEELWKMELKESPLNIWNKIEPYIYDCENFMIIYISGNLLDFKRSFTYSESKIYLNKIK